MKTFIAVMVIALPLFLVVSHQRRRAPETELAIQETSAGEPKAPAKEFPYSVVRGGVHTANEAQQAADDQVVRLHYAGIDTKQLEGTAYKTDRLRYVSYRVGDKVFWTARQVTIKAGEAVLCDGKNFIRARCGNRISEHPMGPIRQDEPSAEELDTAVTTDSGSPIRPASLTTMFIFPVLDLTVLTEQPSEQATSPIGIGPGASPGGYISPASIGPLGGSPSPPVVGSVGPPWVSGAGAPGTVIPPGSVVVLPVVPPIVLRVTPPGPVASTGGPVSPPGVQPVGPAVGSPVVSPIVQRVSPPAVSPVVPPIVQPVSRPVVPPGVPPVAPRVVVPGSPAVPPSGPPSGPPSEPPSGPPSEPPSGPPSEPPIGPPIEPLSGPPMIGPLSEPTTIPPMSESGSLTTPEPDSLLLLGSVLVLGMAIASIRVLRDGCRKH